MDRVYRDIQGIKRSWAASIYIIEQHLDERPFSYFHYAYNVYETHVWFKIKTLEVTTHCMPTIPNKAFQI